MDARDALLNSVTSCVFTVQHMKNYVNYEFLLRSLSGKVAALRHAPSFEEGFSGFAFSFTVGPRLAVFICEVRAVAALREEHLWFCRSRDVIVLQEVFMMSDMLFIF